MAAPNDLTPQQAVDRLLRTDPGPAPQRFGVAVSGGGDSLALLLAAAAFARTVGATPMAATVDHGLRPEAASEARQVGRICADLGIRHQTLTLALTEGPDLQARARTARYDALRIWARTHDLAPVLMGHTQDDVTESLVMRLRRGVGLGGLAAMPEAWRDDHGQDWARPFLDLSRARLRAYLSDHDITPIEDPSNEDLRFERVEIRKALRTLGWTDGALARSAGHLARAAQSYDARLEALFDELFDIADGDLILGQEAAQTLARTEADSLRRLLLAALGAIGHRPPPREAEQWRLIAFVRAPGSPGITLGGCRILRERARLRICRELSDCPPPVPLGTTWDERWEVTGPDAPDLTVGALGHDVELTPWRDGPLPRVSAMAQPAVRHGATLVAAPTVGLPEGYRVTDRIAPHAAFRRRRPFFN